MPSATLPNVMLPNVMLPNVMLPNVMLPNVIPAKAGIQAEVRKAEKGRGFVAATPFPPGVLPWFAWIPAFAGMTEKKAGMTEKEAGMTEKEAGMTEKEAGIRAEAKPNIQGTTVDAAHHQLW